MLISRNGMNKLVKYFFINFRSKCRKNKPVVNCDVDALYLDLEDLKQSKSDGKNNKVFFIQSLQEQSSTQVEPFRAIQFL